MLLLPRCGRRHVPSLSRFANRRPYSSLVTPPPAREQFAVPSRSNGFVTIDVLHSASASPILIYLPSGPVLPNHAEEEERIISTLAASSGATIARINYRASPSHQFPSPVHDVLLGYDWVKDNLLQDGSSRPKLARMGVCGELMGGSLAVTLALTECRNAETRIGAAAVNNPIADWVFPDDLPAVPASELHEPFRPEETAFPADEDPMSPDLSTKEAEAVDIIGNEAATHSTRKHPKRTPKQPPPTSWQLHGDNAIIPTCQLSAERDMLFRIPEHYFDRFASPIHFFRSPHGILISPKDDDKFASEQPDVPLDFETQLDIDHFVERYKSAQATTSPELPILARCRAYARIYPPAGPNLVLPVWHITTGSTSPLLDQSTELTKMIKRSIARQTLKRRAGRSRWHDATEKQYYEEYADSRVQVDPVDGIGLWTQQDGSSDWKAQVERMGAFMKQSLSPEFV